MPNITPTADILTENLFTVEEGQGAIERLSLAVLLARLLSGRDVAGFPRLSAEQRAHWWRFLVRCAAKALRSRGWTVEQTTRMPTSELALALRDGLRAAAGDTDGSRGVWALHQPDPARAGFLQPPTPEGESPQRSGYALNSSSVLTSAIGSKNHERKVEAARTLDAEQTTYALIEFQFGAIFGGRGNYGSQIMGSAVGAGSGSPFMGVRIGAGETETFRHDVGVLLSSWDPIREEHGLRGEVWALWTELWDGKSSLPSQRLDPAFIPLARLVRLGPATNKSEYSEVWFRASTKPRVDDLSGGGDLGDPFAPRVPDRKSPDRLKVRGTLEGGYGYAEIANLLFGTDPSRPGVPPPSVRAAQGTLHDGRPDVRVLFEGTAFEQGKTVGFYRREVVLPRIAADLFADPEPVREVHTEMLARVRDVKFALTGAARILLAGEPKRRDGDEGKVARPADHFDAFVDREYLDSLLRAAERHRREDDTWRGEWARRLTILALASFQETRDAVPTSTARRFERTVRAQSWLERRLRRIRIDAGDPEAAFPTPDAQEALA